MIIDCISDLHGNCPKLEGGDLLIVAGDLTALDTQSQHMHFMSWISQQDYKKKIWIAGNHDNYLVGTKFIPIKNLGMEYLCDSGTEFEGLKIWGSPWTKTFPGMNPHCKAFTVDTEEELAEKFSLIPGDTDILITHSPPFAMLDCTCHGPVGSLELNYAIAKTKARLIVFGHIHEQGGQVNDLIHTKFVNASIVNERYEHVNKPVRIVL